ncbi:MAG: carboxymuconolactone decarboxylase family protein [Rhodospirillaceae bacterium]|nr:carboxymuconolactone decarboxylase family protein [Rhodospirillaceae bacterium]MBT5945620.1 carboxymuconolactone decarboxylase family protein [Rhodospirillaceae bacterium]MBT6403846.1 carboxymuconolactone decarboxylase family protein [Rhodospirillaceae bacterium]MBT6536201.1 carboxymuconolactone decarboxylase family protein [Rhodospirillaceae bacterium]MBT7362089.1 carboxymuconolactone decarboxylase family protein [Rhodospirillaceae bacterium]
MKVRFPPFDPDNLPADARAVYDRIMTERGYVPGPYQFWLASPGFADRIEPVEEFLRHGVSLEERLVEVAVLVVAKHWRAQYVWTSHGPAAEKAGVAPAIVEAIRMGDTPVFKLDDEAVCYRFCTDMIAGREADDTLWAEAQAVFGETGVTELLGLLGLYTSVCLTMVGYRMPTKNGEPEPLP